jgi:hypothetical protein
MTNPARPGGPAVDPRHLLVIGAGPGLGGAIAHLDEPVTSGVIWRRWPGGARRRVPRGC